MTTAINMTAIIAFLVIYAAFSVTMVMLEMYFVKKGSNFLRLLPPLLTFAPTVPYLMHSISGSSLVFSGSAVLAFATLLALLNINTFFIIHCARKTAKKW